MTANELFRLSDQLEKITCRASRSRAWYHSRCLMRKLICELDEGAGSTRGAHLGAEFPHHVKMGDFTLPVAR